MSQYQVTLDGITTINEGEDEQSVRNVALTVARDVARASLEECEAREEEEGSAASTDARIRAEDRKRRADLDVAHPAGAEITVLPVALTVSDADGDVVGWCREIAPARRDDRILVVQLLRADFERPVEILREEVRSYREAILILRGYAIAVGGHLCDGCTGLEVQP